MPGEGLIALADQSPVPDRSSRRAKLGEGHAAYARTGVGGASRKTPRTQNASGPVVKTPLRLRAGGCSNRPWSSIRPGEGFPSICTFDRPVWVSRSCPSLSATSPRAGAAVAAFPRRARRTRIEARPVSKSPRASSTPRRTGGACHSCRRAQRLKHTARFGFAGGPNDGARELTLVGFWVRRERKSARARVYVSRARRAAPPRVRKRPLDARRERLLERRGATPFVSRSERKRKPRKASVRFVFATARRGSRAGAAARRTRAGGVATPRPRRRGISCSPPGPRRRSSDARPRDASDVASYATADASAELTALDRLTRVASASAASAAATSARDRARASRRRERARV